MQNTLAALNNHLFEQIERINGDSLNDEELEQAIKRGESVVKLAETIIKNGELAYKVLKHMDDNGYERSGGTPVMLQS